MSKNYSKADLIAALAEATGFKKRDIEEVIDATTAIIREETNQGKVVSFPGFGKFAVKDRPARLGRNPRTGESVQVAAKSI